MRPRFTLVLVAGLAAGCGGGESVAPVSGRVTLDGQPAVGVHVGFQPLAVGDNKNPGGGSYALTDADGRYTLRMVEGGRPGAVVGKHRVEIATPVGMADDLHDMRPKAANPRVAIPAKFNRESTLTFEVKPGPNEANFDLTSR
jgi:hypothetical protein